MTAESAILRAYALLSQGKYEESEQMLRSVEGVLNTPSGADLFARLRFEQGSEEEARMIWEQIRRAFPDFEPAAKALEAFANPPPSDDEDDDADIVDNGLSNRLKIAAAAAVIIGVLVSVLSAIKGYHAEPLALRGDSSVITNCMERVETQVVTNYVDKVRAEIVERVLTNEIEKVVEVPSSVILTNFVNQIVEVPQVVTNTVTVTNFVSQVVVQEYAAINEGSDDSSDLGKDSPVKDSDSQEIAHSDKPLSQTESGERRPMVLYTPYVVKRGETIGELARRFKFRIPDFRVYNQHIDNIDLVREGQTVNIPGELPAGTVP